jgi:hypothetical protein
MHTVLPHPLCATDLLHILNFVFFVSYVLCWHKCSVEPYSGVFPAWILKKYPQLETEYGKQSFLMPYAGQNILHMAIIKRNHAETRWLLDFYNNRNQSLSGGLSLLLTTAAIGHFFRPDGLFYFGGYPLHFAACTNDQDLFDMVLSYASSVTTEEEKPGVLREHLHIHTRISMLAPALDILDEHDSEEKPQFTFSETKVTKQQRERLEIVQGMRQRDIIARQEKLG